MLRRADVQVDGSHTMKLANNNGKPYAQAHRHRRTLNEVEAYGGGDAHDGFRCRWPGFEWWGSWPREARPNNAMEQTAAAFSRPEVNRGSGVVGVLQDHFQRLLLISIR